MNKTKPAIVQFSTVFLFFFALFNSHASSATAPSNDNFAQAELIAELNTPYFGSNIEATIETDESILTYYPSHSVWWKWTAPLDGKYLISTAGSDFDPLLAVYTGTSMTDLQFAAGTRYPFASEISNNARAGTTYTIWLDGNGDTQDLIQLEISYIRPIGGPINDYIAENIPITALDLVYTGSNVNAGTETSEHRGSP